MANERPMIAVHGHVIEALKTILPLMRLDAANWDDIADEFIMALGGRVVPISREDYDFLITQFRDKNAVGKRLRQ
jgi:hypothetical protein